MVDDGNVPSSREVIDVVVPPISDPVPEEFVDQETGELLTEELASYARERSGTCGGIGVGLEIIVAVLDDLRAFDERGTRPGELHHHLEMLAELERILVETADAEIDGYESPLYELEEDDLSAERETEDTLGEKYPRAAFKIGYVDRISNSNNILAIPRDGSREHFHVSAGIVGEECVLFDPTQEFALTSDITKKPVALPFAQIEEAQKYLEAHSQLPIRKGEIIQMSTTPKKDELVPLPDRGIDGIVVTGNRKVDDETLLVEVIEVREDIAVGEIITKENIGESSPPEWVRGRKIGGRRGPRPDWIEEIAETKEKQEKRSSRILRGSQKEETTNLNELLKGTR